MEQKIICSCCGHTVGRKPNNRGFVQDEACGTVLEVDEKTGKTKYATLEQTAEFVAKKIDARRRVSMAQGQGPEQWYINRKEILGEMMFGCEYNCKGHTIDELTSASSNAEDLMYKLDKELREAEKASDGKESPVRQAIKKIQEKLNSIKGRSVKTEAPNVEQAQTEPGE